MADLRVVEPHGLGITLSVCVCVCVCVCVYIYIYIYVCMYMNIYTFFTWKNMRNRMRPCFQRHVANRDSWGWMEE